MNSQLQRVVDMIKKTMPADQSPCFDGCVLYINEHCMGIRSSCMEDMNIKFKAISDKLDKIINIIGTNGDK